MKKLIGYWRQHWLRLGVILVVVLSVGLTFIYEFEKKVWNSDEIYTMSSSVYPIWNDILVTHDAGGPILRNKEEFQRAVEFTKFDPFMVYENQVKDVHPPLFYLVFHFLALFLSKWIYQIGFLINVICMLLILLVGHAINIGLCTISSLVHPLRLIFVEYYKNAEFEGGGKAYEPFKKA